MHVSFRTKSVPRMVGLVVAMFAILMATAPFMAAQTPAPPTTYEPPRTIGVTGTGTVTATPDTADIHFGIEARNEDLAIAQDEVSANAEELTTTLRDNGIPEDDIQTSAYEIMPVNEYDEAGNFERVDHYRVMMLMQVTVHDIDQVGTLLDQGVSAGATYVDSIAFYVDDPTPYMSQARESAVNDARSKADDYARLSGALITGVYSLEETSAPTPMPEEYQMGDAMMAEGAEMARSVPVNPGSTEIVVTVEIQYAIEPGHG